MATLPEYKKKKIDYNTERGVCDIFIPQNPEAAEELADFESKKHSEREAFYRTPYFAGNRLYRRRKNDYTGEKIIQEPTLTNGSNLK